MRRLAADPALRAEMGRRARAKAEAEFTLETTLRSYDRAYAACRGDGQ
jgi:glycosyltransferase involved in cell wall biosynthesis